MIISQQPLNQRKGLRLRVPVRLKVSTNRLYAGLLVGLLVVMFAGSDVARIGDPWHPMVPTLLRLRLFLILTSSTALMGIALWQIQLMLRVSVRTLLVLLVWFFFALSVIVSALVNRDIRLLVDGFWFLGGLPLLFFFGIPHALGSQAARLTAIALMLGTLPFAFWSLLTEPLCNFLYRGVFRYGNNLAETMLAASVGGFILLNAAIQSRRSLGHILPLVGLLILLLGMILLTSSRVAMGAFFIMAVTVSWWSVTFKPGSFSLVIARPLMRIAAVLAASGVIGGLFFHQSIWFAIEGMVRKFTESIARGDVTNSRVAWWLMTLEETRLFGHGVGYFQQAFGKEAHNVIFQYWGEAGMVAALWLVVFMPLSILMGVNYALRYRPSPYSLAPLLVLLAFWPVALISNVFAAFGYSITLTFFLILGILFADIPPEPLPG